jgi:hypothetical protein
MKTMKTAAKSSHSYDILINCTTQFGETYIKSLIDSFVRCLVSCHLVNKRTVEPLGHRNSVF